MQTGDMIVLSNRYRSIYAVSYHIGIILYETQCKEDAFESIKWVVLWCNGELGAYNNETLHDAWEVKCIE